MARNPEQSSGEQLQNRSVEAPTRYEASKHHEHEHNGAEDKKFDAESARAEALKSAIENKTYHEQQSQDDGQERHYASPKGSRKQGFSKTMDRVQKNMPAPQRLFSKVIHSPVIEKASDILGSTVARPDAILSGSVCAFIFTAVLYFTARHLGFALSGSETIAAFIIGWLIGLLFDLLRSMFRRSG